MLVATVVLAGNGHGAAKYGDRFAVLRYSENGKLVYVKDGARTRVFKVEQLDITQGELT